MVVAFYSGKLVCVCVCGGGDAEWRTDMVLFYCYSDSGVVRNEYEGWVCALICGGMGWCLVL